MSWASEEGIDSYDPEDIFTASPDLDVWTDVDKVDVPIGKLSTYRLAYILRGLESGKSYWGQGWKLNSIKVELFKRADK